MQFIALILLILCHLLSGYGILTLFDVRQKTGITITLSLILGVAVASFLPFLLQLFYLTITPASVFISLVIACLLLNIRTFLLLRSNGLPSFRTLLIRLRSFRVEWYEIPYLLIIGFLVFVSVWRCYYLPPTSRDALSGPEAIAEFAVREHTMINSFFSIDLWTTNNQFKSPFLISLQIIYKMAGFPFGQVWLSIIFVSFTVLLYKVMKERVHPVIAGLLLLIFLMTPEVYAYTFMILYDYSNMVYLFLGLYFLFDYFKSKLPADFYLATLLMGLATYIRSETLFLVALFIPPILVAAFRDKLSYKKMAWMTGLFVLPSLAGYYLTTQLYIRHYLPVKYDIGALVNTHLTDLHPLFGRYGDILTHLMMGEFAIHLWGYIMYIFFVLLLAEALLMRGFSKEARNWLYAILVVYVGLGILGWLLPLMNLNETTKRGMFKILPLMLMYMASNEWLLRLSAKIRSWEQVPLLGQLAVSKGKPPAGGKLMKSPVGGAGAATAAKRGTVAPKGAGSGDGAKGKKKRRK
jgi:hypothetical protein